MYTYKYHEFLMAPCESAIPLDSVCYDIQKDETRSHGGSQLALREQSLTLREKERKRERKRGRERETVEKRD